MRIYEVEERTEALVGELCQVWEASVRATHLFLTDEAIGKIAVYVPQALRAVPHLVVAVGDGPQAAAFMGIAGKKLEMLFIAPAERGKGLGKRLMQYGVARYGVDRLGVNEQNPQAVGFYERMGFRVYKRVETDEQGNAYPILYMRRGK